MKINYRVILQPVLTRQLFAGGRALRDLGKDHGVKARFGVLRKAGENNRNMKSGVLVTGARDYNAIAMNSAIVAGRL